MERFSVGKEEVLDHESHSEGCRMTSDNLEVRHRTGNKLPSHSRAGGPSRATEEAGLTVSISEPCDPPINCCTGGRREILTIGMTIQLTATHALDAAVSVPQSSLT